MSEEEIRAKMTREVVKAIEIAAKQVENVDVAEANARAERQMIVRYLDELTQRVESGLTRGFDIKWKAGEALDATELVHPTIPCKFITLQLTLPDGGLDV